MRNCFFLEFLREKQFLILIKLFFMKLPSRGLNTKGNDQMEATCDQ
jgi:hypothetical protein